VEPSRVRPWAALLLVALAVTACGGSPQPRLNLSKNALALESAVGRTRSDTFTITNQGPESVRLRLSAAQGWLTVSPTTVQVGAGQDRTVTVSGACLAATPQSGQVTVKWDDNGATLATVNVDLSCHAAPASDFDIDVVFFGATPPTPTQQAVFEAAAARWSELIVGDLPPRTLSVAAGACGGALPAVNMEIDDVAIWAKVELLDGPNGLLGYAGPCHYRTVGGEPMLPVTGYMVFDSADLEALESVGRLQDVILHEMGHVLGIGTFWEDPGMHLDAPCTPGGTVRRFVGPEANARHTEAGGVENQLLVESDGGVGTACGHWDDETYANELMTGYLSAGENPLSAITVGSLADIGYEVSYLLADDYAVPAPDAVREADAGFRIGEVVRFPPEPLD